MDKKLPFGTLEVIFWVMIVVPAFLPRHTIDPAHAHMAALFRLALNAVGLIGLVTVIVVKRRQANASGAVTTMNGQTQLMDMPAGDAVEWTVNDRSTRADFWRGNLFFLMRRWQTGLALLIAPTILSFSVAVPISHRNPGLAAVAAAFIFGIWIVFIALVLGAGMLKRYPKSGSVRLCTTTLTRMGYQDITPDKAVFVPWAEVSKIEESSGDVYLWRAIGSGNYVSRNAFQSVMEAREFCQKAQELCKNPMPIPESGYQTPASAYQPTVWPPPPQG